MQACKTDSKQDARGTSTVHLTWKGGYLTERVFNRDSSFSSHHLFFMFSQLERTSKELEKEQRFVQYSSNIRDALVQTRLPYAESYLDFNGL